MRFLRWLLGVLMVLLVLVVRDRFENAKAPQILKPKYERTSLQERDYVFYTVQPGDDLSMIEKKFRIASRDSILKLNPQLDPDQLPENKQIKIPLQ